MTCSAQGDDGEGSRLIIIRLDRLRLNSWAKAGAKLPKIGGFKTLKGFRPKPLGKSLPYGRVLKLKEETSDTKVDWEYERQKGWLRQWRITLIADDKTGLTPSQVRKFVKRCRFYTFLIFELALDFGPGSSVDCEFVKRHALFGKSRRRRDLEHPGEVRYGSRKSGKFVRCYWKPSVNAFRVELEIHSRLLKKGQIETLEDLPDVPYVIRPSHLRFVRINWKALRHYAERKFGGCADVMISKTKRKAYRSIHNALRFLRRQGVNNPHRFLVSMRINKTIETALTNWSIDFAEGMNE